MDRRTALCTAAALGVGSLAGCLGTDSGSEDAPDPVALSGTKYDYQGGMEIGAHGGPNGQIFYQDEQPEPVAGSAAVRTVHEDHDDSDADSEANLAWFHTLVSGLFPYHFERRERGWTAEVIYVTDYSSVEWDLPEDSSRPVMPAPTSADSFAAATELTYVGESDALGGMGAALHPFSDPSDAESFAETYSGTRYEFEEINRGLIDSLQNRQTA